MSGPRISTARLGGQPALGRFAAVGALTTILDFVLFSALVGSFGLIAGIANMLSYSCGIVASFLLNRYWTFGQRPVDARGAFGRFVVTHAAGLGLSTLLVAGLATFLPDQLAKIASVPIVFVWNFALANRWVFR